MGLTKKEIEKQLDLCHKFLESIRNADYIHNVTIRKDRMNVGLSGSKTSDYLKDAGIYHIELPNGYPFVIFENGLKAHFSILNSKDFAKDISASVSIEWEP